MAKYVMYTQPCLLRRCQVCSLS